MRNFFLMPVWISSWRCLFPLVLSLFILVKRASLPLITSLIRASSPSFLLAEQTLSISLSSCLQFSSQLCGLVALHGPPSAGCQCLSNWGNSTDTQNSGCGRVKSWHLWSSEHTLTRPAQGRVCPHPCCETAADLCSAFCSPALPKPHLSKQEPSLGHCLGLFHPICKAFDLLLLKLMLFLLTQSSSLLCFLFLRRLLSLLYVLSIPSFQLFIQILNTMCILLCHSQLDIQSSEHKKKKKNAPALYRFPAFLNQRWLWHVKYKCTKAYLPPIWQLFPRQ